MVTHIFIDHLVSMGADSDLSLVCYHHIHEPATWNHGTVREGTLTLAAAIAFMFAMSMAPQRPHRQWQVNANGRLNALFSMGRGVDRSQLGRYTKVKRVYIVQCTRKWLKHKLMIIFGYFILEILITVVTAKPFVNVGVLVLFIMSEVSHGETELT